MKKRVNGVWQTDPYMLYEENEFDTNTFPVNFYSKGGNIPNWSVAGNSVQASTPTPTNPVEIAQFGDLITSGVNAGKYDISITSAGQTKHIILTEPLRKIGTYVDTVDSDGAVTRRTGQYIITDGLSVSSYTSGASGIGFSFEMNTMMRNARRIGICTHFEPQTSPSGSTLDGVTFGVNNFRIYFTFSAQTATSLNLTNINDVRAWIDAQYANGTPVTVYYVLETPTTEVIHGNNFFDDSKSGMIQINASTQRYGTSLGALQAGTYTISYTLDNPNSNMFYGYRIDDTYQSGQIQNTSQASASPYTLILPSNVDDFFIRSSRSDTTMSWAEQGYSSIMINEGSTALPYEPYQNAPDLPTSVGTNTLDFGTTLKPSRFTADFGKMFVPRTEKKRVNGAWI